MVEEVSLWLRRQSLRSGFDERTGDFGRVVEEDDAFRAVRAERGVLGFVGP